jgi:N-hydroxyarylamine O-acetyltransferase
MMQNHNFQKMDRDLLNQYLRILGVKNNKPTLGALTELVGAHLTHVPFENISKIYYRKNLSLNSLPDLQTYLDGIERYHFGGTCFSNNYYFYLLLANLGYAVTLCGADMKNPDAHMVSMVKIEGREFLLDVGYAAPFLSPIPRDLDLDYSIILGRDTYVVKPQDGKGYSRLELYRDGILKHGYVAKPELKALDDFAIVDSYREEATFMNTLLLARFYPDRSIVINNFTMIESQGALSRSYELKDRDILIQAVEDLFDMPRLVVMDAVSQLRDLQDPWSGGVAP